MQRFPQSWTVSDDIKHELIRLRDLREEDHNIWPLHRALLEDRHWSRLTLHVGDRPVMFSMVGHFVALKALPMYKDEDAPFALEMKPLSHDDRLLSYFLQLSTSGVSNKGP